MMSASFGRSGCLIAVGGRVAASVMASIQTRDEALLKHQPRPRAHLFGLAFELAASGEYVTSARRPYRARVAGVEHDVGEALDHRPLRAFVRAARPRIERDQVDLRRDILQ